jgi:hypothetical protein
MARQSKVNPDPKEIRRRMSALVAEKQRVEAARARLQEPDFKTLKSNTPLSPIPGKRIYDSNVVATTPNQSGTQIDNRQRVREARRGR